MTKTKPEKPETKPVQTRLPVELIDRIDQQAADREQTRSDRLADLVMRGLEVEVLEKIAGDHAKAMELLGIIHDQVADLAAYAKGEK